MIEIFEFLNDTKGIRVVAYLAFAIVVLHILVNGIVGIISALRGGGVSKFYINGEKEEDEEAKVDETN